MYFLPISAACWLAGPTMTPSLIMSMTFMGFIEFRKKTLFALHAAKIRDRAACSEHLCKHPRIRMHGRFVRAIHGHIDNDSRRAVAALGRTTRRESLHVLGKTFDVIRRMFHVIADVVGIGLCVFLSLFETALGSRMRPV